MIERVRKYLREVWQEMSKITWPTRDELKESTMIVIIATFFVTIFIFLIDRVIAFGVNGIIRLFS